MSAHHHQPIPDHNPDSLHAVRGVLASVLWGLPLLLVVALAVWGVCG